MADNVLKPLMLGRGVDAPMPVILIGALGGMATTGILMRRPSGWVFTRPVSAVQRRSFFLHAGPEGGRPQLSSSWPTGYRLGGRSVA